MTTFSFAEKIEEIPSLEIFPSSKPQVLAPTKYIHPKITNKKQKI